MLFLSLIVAIACGTALVGAGEELPLENDFIVDNGVKKVIDHINDKTGSACALKDVEKAELEDLVVLLLVINLECTVEGQPKPAKCSPVLDYIPDTLGFEVKKTECDDPKLNGNSS
jgi:hypothetical protein